MSTSDRSAFVALLGDVEVSEFFELYWLKQPVVLRPAEIPTILRVDEKNILNWYADEGRTDHRYTSFNSQYSARAEGRVRIESLFADDTSVPERLWALAHNEALIIRDLAEVPRFKAYCAEIMKFWRSRCSLNCYLVRSGADHFPMHQDGHHIFAIQTKGRKRWYLYPPSIVLPMSYYRRQKEVADPLEATVIDVDAGHILYIPTGWRHHADTLDDVSIHFSLGLHPLRWVDLLKDLCELAGARHRPLREYVPFMVGESGIEYAGVQIEDAFARLGLLERDLVESVKVLLDYHNHQEERERR